MVKNKSILLYTKIALALFFLSALYGLLIRLSAIEELYFFNYAKFLQAHSHVTFLGWGFMGVTAMFNWLFLPEKLAFSKFYTWLFGIEFTTIALMLFSFPLQGYKVFSIVLLSVFLITSYVYIIQFYKDYSKNDQVKEISRFIKASLLFYLVSSIGIWGIGIVVATQGKTDLYYNSIYFYLHFLYNGFFVFALFGLLFKYLTTRKLVFSVSKLNIFFWLTFLTCPPAFLLSLVNSDSDSILTIGFLSASFQLISLYFLIGLIQSIKFKSVVKLTRLKLILLSVIIISYILKITLQFGSAFPQLAEEIITLKSYFVIGYIHLVTLGFMSSFMILFLIELKLINESYKLTQLGLVLYLLGVTITETVLFSQGLIVSNYQSSFPNYSYVLLMASSILVSGIGMLLLSIYLKKHIKYLKK